MNDLALNTVCQEARCPNIFECWSAGTATFMILGEICTRRCTFCAVGKGKPLAADADEPRRVAEAVAKMGVRHAVITMVNRDDMPDGGAEHVAQTVAAVRERTGAAVEVLISDLEGNRDALRVVIASRARGARAQHRDRAAALPAGAPGGEVSALARRPALGARGARRGMLTKSSLMLGLGETEEEILARRAAICARPASTSSPWGSISRRPEIIIRCAATTRRRSSRSSATRARALGFHHVESAPLVRSSYMAHRAVRIT